MAGQITTCYSFKGGSGRSMTLANMAWVLAARGSRVLVVDWDLEAPGVHRYFHPFLADPLQKESDGLIDGLWAYVNAVPDGAVRRKAEYAAMAAYTQSLSLPLIKGGSIDLLGAGRQDATYTTKVGNFDWSTFYARFGGKGFVDEFGKWARTRYDHVLIDSRTGVSDTAGLCTMQLPDVLALFFVYNRQSIEGTAAAGRAVRGAAKSKHIRIVPCPSRVEDKKVAQPARQYAAMCFEDVLGEKAASLTRTLRVNEVMHFAWCSYEEKLAVFEDEQDENGTLLQATEALSTRVAGTFKQTVEVVGKEKLAASWRRAAFLDPRLEELEGLRSGSLSQRLPQLKVWIGETLEEASPGPAWSMALADECIALADAGPRLIGASEIEMLARSATSLARRTAERPGTDRTAVAAVLRWRASHLAAAGRLGDARAVANEAIGLIDGATDDAARMVLAGLLEARADVERLAGNFEAALATLRELVVQRERVTARSAPSTRDDRARASRLMAQTLFELGWNEKAVEEAEMAFRIAKGGSDDSPEPALARLLTVRAALAAGGVDADRVVARARRWIVREDMPDTLRREFEVRLAIAEAEHYAASGAPDRARALLMQLEDDLPAWAMPEFDALSARVGGPAGPAGREEVEQVLRQALSTAGDSPENDRRLIRLLRDHGVGTDPDARTPGTAAGGAPGAEPTGGGTRALPAPGREDGT